MKKIVEAEKAIVAVLAIITALTIWTNAIAATYYVDATSGNDSNDALSPSRAWKTIFKVNMTSFRPGDNILLKRSEIWRETLRPSSSGIAGNPITYGAYGPGSYPVIVGADIVTSWNHYGADEISLYRAAVSREVKVSAYNGRQIKRRQDKEPQELDLNEFNWIDPYLYVNVGENPSAGTLESSQRLNIRVRGKSWIVIEDLHLLYGDRGVFITDNSSNVTVRNCLVEKIYHHGIYSVDTRDFFAHDNVVIGGTENIAYCQGGILSRSSANVYQNDVSFCTIGIQFEGQIVGGSIVNNHVHHIFFAGEGGCDTPGIDCQGIELTGPGYGEQISEISVVGNKVHSCGGSCIATFESSNNRIGYNVVYDCGNEKRQAGIADWQHSRDNIFYNNTVYRSHHGFGASGASRYINNIAMSSRVFGIDENTPGNPNTFHHNCVYDSGEANYHWTTQAPYDINEDPDFIDADRFDFYLQPSSRLVDSGVVIEGLTEYSGNGVDIGAKEGLLKPPSNLSLVP